MNEASQINEVMSIETTTANTSVVTAQIMTDCQRSRQASQSTGFRLMSFRRRAARRSDR